MQNFEENLEHMMQYCDGIQVIRTEIEISLCKVLHINYEICLLNVLLGHCDDDQFSTDVVNIVLSIVRWGIWKRKNYIRHEKDNFPAIIAE